jgi:uncharacterized protein
MKFHVIVKTKAREQKIVKIEDSTFSVSVRELPIDGKANAAVIRALADHFGIPKSRVILLSGETSKHKYISVDT